MKIIVVTGLPLSGKSTHCKVIGNDLGIPIVETGTFVYEEVKKRGLEATPDNIRNVADECKAQSDSFFTERAVEFIEKEYPDASAVFLNGVKALSELKFLNNHFGSENVKVVSFHASVNTRYHRLQNADRQAASSQNKGKSLEDKLLLEDFSKFEARDEKELGYGLGTLIALSDYLINTDDRKWPYHNNAHTLREFKLVVQDIINPNIDQY